MVFAEKYGPWALVAGASDGVGAALAETLAERGLNVVLVARREAKLREVADGIAERMAVETKVVAVDLSAAGATETICAATEGLEIGYLAYCAGADPEFSPFLAKPIASAEAMLERNCAVPMRLCHHFVPAMVERGRGGILIFGSGAGFVGGPNMVAYGASKAFDMVFAEALWSELHGSGVDVVGLILGKTDTPALRALEHSRGNIASLEETPDGAAPVVLVVETAMSNMANGPTVYVGADMAAAAGMFASMSRNDAVRMMTQMINTTMGD